MTIKSFINYIEKINKELRETLSLDVELIPLCLKNNIAIASGKNARYVTNTLLKLKKIEDFCEIKRMGRKAFVIKF